MASDPGVPTIHNLKDAKAALKTFQDLQKTMNSAQNSDGVGALSEVTTLQSAVGPLISDAGTKVDGYYKVRGSAVNSAITACQTGVAGIITMLQSSISMYEANEHGNANTANNTGKGGGGSTSGSGNTSGMG